MNSPRKHRSRTREQLDVSGDNVRRARLQKKMRIALRIANAIDAHKWDNKNLADKLDKYQSQITKWLKGDHNFTIDTLSDIEEILGIKLLVLDDADSKLVFRQELTNVETTGLLKKHSSESGFVVSENSHGANSFKTIVMNSKMALQN